MPTLEIDGLAIHYETQGKGPTILIPRCNFPWSSLDLGLLADYRVVVASPRGYGLSGRLPTRYSAATIRSDLESVLDHLGVDEYVPFGYSMTGSVAAWLGHANRRVRAVVSGGFPTATSYAALLPFAHRSLAQLQMDPDEWKATTTQFDPDALLEWYRELDSIPAGGLVDQLDCPVFSYWAENDEVIEELVGLDALRSAMLIRRLPFQVIPDTDHGGLLTSINVSMPGVLKWLHHTVPPGE